MARPPCSVGRPRLQLGTSDLYKRLFFSSTKFARCVSCAPPHRGVRTIVWPNESSVNFSGASFCDNQDDFSQLSRFCWSVYRVSHTEGIIELRGETGWNKLKSLSAIILGASVSKIESTGAVAWLFLRRQTRPKSKSAWRGLRLLAGSTKR